MRIFREIEFQISAENQKCDLIDCDDFNMQVAYNTMNINKNHQITYDDLRLFLRKMGHFVKKDELIAILRRLDLDGD